MDFKEALKQGADEVVQAGTSNAEHLIRQAFFAGVMWYMNHLRSQRQQPTSTNDD